MRQLAIPYRNLSIEQRDALTNIEEGFKIFNTDLQEFQMYKDNKWITIYFDSTVGIGGEYATIYDAVQDNKHRLRIISDITEPNKITVDKQLLIYGADFYTITFNGTEQIFVNSNLVNIHNLKLVVETNTTTSDNYDVNLVNCTIERTNTDTYSTLRFTGENIIVNTNEKTYVQIGGTCNFITVNSPTEYTDYASLLRIQNADIDGLTLTGYFGQLIAVINSTINHLTVSLSDANTQYRGILQLSESTISNGTGINTIDSGKANNCSIDWARGGVLYENCTINNFWDISDAKFINCEIAATTFNSIYRNNSFEGCNFTSTDVMNVTNPTSNYPYSNRFSDCYFAGELLIGIRATYTRVSGCRFFNSKGVGINTDANNSIVDNNFLNYVRDSSSSSVIHDNIYIS